MRRFRRQIFQNELNGILELDFPFPTARGLCWQPNAIGKTRKEVENFLTPWFGWVNSVQRLLDRYAYHVGTKLISKDKGNTQLYQNIAQTTMKLPYAYDLSMRAGLERSMCVHRHEMEVASYLVVILNARLVVNDRRSLFFHAAFSSPVWYSTC